MKTSECIRRATKAYYERLKAKGFKKRSIWANDAEWEKVKEFIRKIREQNEGMANKRN